MLARLLLTALVWSGIAFPSLAAEYIRSYHSEIEVAADGRLTITETITVNAEGRDIRRGVFRDFPLTMADEEGRTVRVGFDVLSVTGDGPPEAWSTEVSGVGKEGGS